MGYMRYSPPLAAYAKATFMHTANAWPIIDQTMVTIMIMIV